MELRRRSNIGFQNNLIIEEKLTANYIQKISKRNEYLEKQLILEDNITGVGTDFFLGLNGALVLSVGMLTNVDILMVEKYLNLQVMK